MLGKEMIRLDESYVLHTPRERNFFAWTQTVELEI